MRDPRAKKEATPRRRLTLPRDAAIHWDVRLQVLSAGVALWGDGDDGPMRGVDGVVDYFLSDENLPTDPNDPAAYSVVPVNIWGHNVTEACEVARRLEASGRVVVATPGAVMAALRGLGGR